MNHLSAISWFQLVESQPQAPQSQTMAWQKLHSLCTSECSADLQFQQRAVLGLFGQGYLGLNHQWVHDFLHKRKSGVELFSPDAARVVDGVFRQVRIRRELFI